MSENDASSGGFWSALKEFGLLIKNTANPRATHPDELTQAQLDKMSKYESFDYHTAYPDMYMEYLRQHSGTENPSVTHSVMMMDQSIVALDKREKKNAIVRTFLLIFTGIVVSLVAAMIAYSVETIEEFRAKTLTFIMECTEIFFVNRTAGFFFWLMMAVALGAISSGVVVFIEPIAAGGGIPDVMAYLNGVHVPRVMNLKTFWVKVVSCTCAVASGLPVGMEAPLIHLGAITGAGVTQGRSKSLKIQTNLFRPFRNHRDRCTFMTIGAACGVSTAFGAPIGGLLFVMEEISTFWDQSASSEVFLASMIAVTTTTMIDSLLQEGKLLGWVSNSASVLFEVNISIPFNLKSIFPAFLLGCFLGALAALFTKLNIILLKLRRAKIAPFPKARFLETVCLALIYAMITYILSVSSSCHRIKPISNANETVLQWGTEDPSRLFTDSCKDPQQTYSPLGTLLMSSGKNAIRHLFTRQTVGQFPVYYMIVYALIYTFYACISSGMAISGGLVVPSLVVGAAFGRVYGMILFYIFATNVNVERGYRDEDAWLDPGLFALIGAAAFLAGTSRLGISVCVIMVELSSELRYLLPLMVAIVSSRAVANYLCEPLYHHILHLDCVPYLSPKLPSPEFEQLTAADVMVMDVVTLKTEDLTTNILAALETTHHAFPVVEEVFESAGEDSAERLVTLAAEQKEILTVTPNEKSCQSGKERREKKKTYRFVGLVTREDLHIFLTLPHLGVGMNTEPNWRQNISNSISIPPVDERNCDKEASSSEKDDSIVDGTPTGSRKAGATRRASTGVEVNFPITYTSWIRQKHSTYTQPLVTRGPNDVVIEAVQRIEEEDSLSSSSDRITPDNNASGFIRESRSTGNRSVVIPFAENDLPEMVNFSAIVNRSPWVIPSFFNLSMAYRTFSSMGLRHIVVVNGNEVCGIITRKDLLPNSLRQRLKELHRRMEVSGGAAVTPGSPRTQ